MRIHDGRPDQLPPDGYTADLCHSLHALYRGRWPPEVLAAIPRFVLDTLGVLAGAKGAPGLEAFEARCRSWEPDGTATSLLSGARLSPPTAAMLNAAAAHALDFDDQHDPARVHTYCVLLPALLAIAEGEAARGCPVAGGDFLKALALGAELNARLGLACPRSLAHGWHPTMTFGTLSAAVAGAALLGLDAPGMGRALGIALHQAGGTAQCARDGVLAKRLGAGFAARAAVTSACLAADGITGPTRALEGTAGLFALYERGDVRPALLTEELGARWRVLEYSLKPYPCCRCNHGAIALALAMHAEGVRAGDVVAIEVHMGALNHLTVGAPYAPERNDVVAAQFSVSFGVAVALARGEVRLAAYRGAALTDPELVALTRRTRVLEDDGLDATAIEPVRLRVTLHSGQVLERHGEVLPGSPAWPMSAAEVEAKFDDCLRAGFGAAAGSPAPLKRAVAGLAASHDAGGELASAFRLAAAGVD